MEDKIMKSFKFEEPEEINDIEQQAVEEEELKEFLEKFVKLSNESKNTLFKDIALRNIINPNSNKFSSISKKNLMKLQLKQHIQKFKEVDDKKN